MSGDYARGMLEGVFSVVVAQAEGPVRGAADASSLSRMHVLVIVLGAALLLLAWLVIVTIMRRALKSVGPESAKKPRADSARPSPWQEAGQRAQPMEDTKGRDRPSGEEPGA